MKRVKMYVDDVLVLDGDVVDECVEEGEVELTIHTEDGQFIVQHSE